MSPIRIRAANLLTCGTAPTDTQRKPISRLGEGGDDEHVHGTLIIEIAGRAVPHLGYFGPDDVCLDTWLVELCEVVNALAARGGEYTFDEGEQGQPAFTFRRVGDDVAFSIDESLVGGGRADPEWQDVRFLYRDFRAAVLRLLDELRGELRWQAPMTWQGWWPREARITTP